MLIANNRERVAKLLVLSLMFGFVIIVTTISTPNVSAQTTSPVIKINEAAANSDITVEQLRGNLSVLFGSGGNIVVLNGPDGKLLVDDGIAISKDKLQAALDRISAEPIKYVINTHWHWDHTDGNEWVHNQGATIIAHENVLKRLSATTRVEDWDYTLQPRPMSGRPTVTFKTEKTLKFDGETIVIKNFGQGHTDGDALVYFPKADVLALGDNFWNGIYPFIDNGVGGGIDGMIRWVNASLALATDKTIIVPGHGPVGNKAQLEEFRDMLATVRSNVAVLKKQGKSIDEIITAKPTAEYDARWGNFVIDPAFFTRLVYAGL